jgi:hypothetical protein
VQQLRLVLLLLQRLLFVLPHERAVDALLIFVLLLLGAAVHLLQDLLQKIALARGGRNGVGATSPPADGIKDLKFEL